MNLRTIAVSTLVLSICLAQPTFAHKHHHRPEYEFLIKADRAEIIDAYFRQCDELHNLQHAYNHLKKGSWRSETFKNGMGAGAGLTVAGLASLYALYCYIKS